MLFLMNDSSTDSSDAMCDSYVVKDEKENSQIYGYS